MVYQIAFDFSQWEKRATELGASIDQIPFAMSVALNTAVENTRSYLIKTTWPKGIKQRNQSFIAASLTTKGARATKTDLTAEIYDKLGRGNLVLHAKGGMRRPRLGSTLAIPEGQARAARTEHGVPKNLRPRNVLFNKRGVRIKDAIYQRDRKGKLQLLYVLKQQTRIPKRVLFYEDFARVMTKELLQALPAAVMRAMATRRVR